VYLLVRGKVLIKLQEYQDLLSPDGNVSLAALQQRNQPVVKCEVKLKSVTITVAKGDITTYDVDVVVNSANETLDDTRGISKAIADAGVFITYLHSLHTTHSSLLNIRSSIINASRVLKTTSCCVVNCWRSLNQLSSFDQLAVFDVT
jgi:hypothetical protein